MKAFVIYLPGAPKNSINVFDIVSQLECHGLDAQAFKGVSGNLAAEIAKDCGLKLWPYSMKSRSITPDDLEWAKLSRPGVIGCFLSHYQLWEHCIKLDEPVMIFEDDVKLYRGWAPVQWQDILILSLGKNSASDLVWKNYLENPVDEPAAVPWPNHSMPGTSGYAIMPGAARHLVNTYRGYWTASDNAINQNVCDIKISNHIMGRHMTIEEGNVSLTKKKW